MKKLSALLLIALMLVFVGSAMAQDQDASDPNLKLNDPGTGGTAAVITSATFSWTEAAGETHYFQNQFEQINELVVTTLVPTTFDLSSITPCSSTPGGFWGACPNDFISEGASGTLVVFVYNDPGGIPSGIPYNEYFSFTPYGWPADQVFNAQVVPEPASLMMFGSSLLGLCGLLRRKLRK